MKKRSVFLSFWAFIIYFLIIFAIATALLMGRLNSYLEEYESCQPSNISDEYLEAFLNRDVEALLESAPSDCAFTKETLAAYLDVFVNDDTLFCYRASSSDNALIYDYISNNKKLASLTLVKSEEKSPRGFDIYSVSSLVFRPLMRYTITAPSDCTVYINGHDIAETRAEPESFITDDTYEPFDGYLSSSVRYTIDYPEYITDITAKHDGNAEISLIKSTVDENECDIEYMFGYEMSDEMKSALDSRAREAVEAYIYYTTLHSIPVSTVLPYIHKNATLYKNIQMFDNTWSNSRSKDEFTKFDVTEFEYFSDTHAACRVSAIYRLYKYAGPRDFDFDFKVYFVNDGGSWYITSMERVMGE